MSIQAIEGVSQAVTHLGNVQAVMAKAKRSDLALPELKPRRQVETSRLFGFETMAFIDGNTVKKMMKKVSLADLIMALTGAEKGIKEAALGNMPVKLREISEITISKMESGLLPFKTVSRSRDIISDAFLEILREESK